MQVCLHTTLQSIRTWAPAAFLALVLPATGLALEPIQEYANACSSSIGEPVPGFDCVTQGNEIPMSGTEGGTCEKPPYLPFAGCYKGSRIGQLAATSEDVLMVFLCRKKRTGNAAYQFDDIAVIQTNYKTGATCFFQRLEKGTDGRNVPAPKDDTAGFWMEPSEMRTDDNACVQCHDNGPFLRTPYVMQRADVIDAYKAKFRNKTEYFFPGNQWLGWNGKIFRVTVKDNTNCTVCHTMGANSIDQTVGTSSWLGPYSTGLEPSPFLDDPITNNDTAHWMKPSRVNTQPSHDDQVYSGIWKECATTGNSDCTLQLWGGQLSSLLEERGDRPGRAKRRVPAE